MSLINPKLPSYTNYFILGLLGFAFSKGSFLALLVADPVSFLGILSGEVLFRRSSGLWPSLFEPKPKSLFLRSE